MVSDEIEAPTARGPARVHVDRPEDPRGLLVLGHGAGGGVDAPDLVAVRDLALERGLVVARVLQPYRVAGKRMPDRAPALDDAFTSAVSAARGDTGGPLIVGGRSSGARVACRTAGPLGADGVLCLAFPVNGRRRRDGSLPPSRLPEIDAVEVPVLVVQGDRDPFGCPPSRHDREVVVVKADHSLKKAVDDVRQAAGAWLDRLLA